jgi:hypothetical protein
MVFQRKKWKKFIKLENRYLWSASEDVGVLRARMVTVPWEFWIDTGGQMN